MSIITKPSGGVLKGVPATFTLSKVELLSVPMVSADSYFSVTTNWNKVILSYKSFDGNQQEIVEFNATLSSPTGFFDVSLTARNFFEIQVIKIIDFDGGIFIVPRSELVIADFDVIFVSPPSSLSYTTPVIYTQNETITNNVPSVIGTVNSYSISPALPTGLTINPTTGVISGTPTVAVAAANYTVTASNSGGPTTAIVNITVESEIIDEFWDVANKSGVGTVSVGANRLITKTSGGGSYDVNVLSLETITGDGYIEFPNSSFLNIGNSGVSVIGLAEQTSPNGGFQNIILGAFTVSNNWEKVVNGSISGVISATNPNDIVRIGRIGTEYYIKINDVIKTQVTINNTNPLKASISLFTTGTGVDNITVESAEVPVGDPIIWDLFLNGATTEADGGLIGASTAAYSFTKSNANKIDNGADFKITYKFTDLVADWVHGISSVLTEESQSQFNFTGLTYQQSFLISYYRGVQQPNQSLSILNSPGENTLIIEKTGTNLTFTLNNTVVLSKTDYTEQLTVPAVRPWNVRALDSATVELLEAPAAGTYIIYNLDGYTTPATKNAFGGVSGGVYTANTDVAVKSSVDAASGDFDYEWKLDWSSATSISNMFVGVTGNNIVNGTSFYPNLTCLYGSLNNPDIATLWHNNVSGAGNVNLTLLNGDNYYRLIRTGSTITHFFNGVQVYSASSTPFTAYPTVRTMGNEACKESYISAVDEINAFNSAYISLPEPGKIVRLQPSINSSRDARFWFSEPLTGDFTFTATVKAGNVGESVVQALFGLNNIIPPATSNYGVKQGGWGFSFDASGNLNIWDTTTIQTWTKGSSYNIEIKRVSGVISFKVGSTTSTYTLNNTSTLYIAGTLQIGSWEVTNASLVLPAPSVTWNVAGKTGVGTVTTGANGLITKATGGNSYNVNVLSNEIITGDGYVEFINSSIFSNVVFGLAEINSSSGSYDQIIYGTYVAGLGTYERVLAGQAIGGSMAASAYGDVIRIQRIGNTFSILKNGSVINTVTINNTNPLKASISIFAQTYGVNNVTIAS